MSYLEGTGDLELVADGWEVLEGCSHIRIIELLVKHHNHPASGVFVDIVREAVL